MKITHISDLHSHFPAWLKKAEGHVVCTGDTLDDGAGFELEKAEKFLRRFHGRLTLLKGNHDDSLRGNVYSAESAERFDALSERLQGFRWLDKKPLVRRIEEGGAVATIIGLNSCTQTDAWSDLACGQIGAPQLAELDAELNRAEGVRILALHHHPFYDSRIMGLLDAPELLRVIAGRVDVLLFGHRHKPEKWEGYAGARHIISAPATWLAGWVDEIDVQPGGSIAITQRRLA